MRACCAPLARYDPVPPKAVFSPAPPVIVNAPDVAFDVACSHEQCGFSYRISDGPWVVGMEYQPEAPPAAVMALLVPTFVAVPVKVTRSRIASFAFTLALDTSLASASIQANAMLIGFSVRLDDVPLQDLSTERRTLTVQGLAPGPHALAIRARLAGGSQVPTPVMCVSLPAHPCSVHFCAWVVVVVVVAAAAAPAVAVATAAVRVSLLSLLCACDSV